MSDISYTYPVTLTTDSSDGIISIDTSTNNSYISWNNAYVWSTFAVSDDDHPLKKLNYTVIFEEDKNFLLQNNISKIKKNKIIFNCNREKDDNRIQPYELIMDLIKQKKSFSLKVKLSDILTINYSNFRFTKIENNFNFNNAVCDFSSITVKFKYDKILYENHQLDIRDSRIDKLKKIMENI